MSHEKRPTARTSNVAGGPVQGRGYVQNGNKAPSPQPPQRNRRTRSNGATVVKWLSLVVAVPTLSFFVTLYAPSISHAFQNPQHRVVSHAVPASVAATTDIAAATPATDTTPDVVGELPDGSANLPNPDVPLTIQSFEANQVPIRVVMGGTPGSRRSPIRQGVEDFVRQAGATAGLNGTFFANASLEGTDNLLIGPSMCGPEQHLLDSPFDNRPQLAGRPMVLMSAKRTIIVPYQAGLTDDEETLRGYLPGMTDAFLGGVWLVHNGQAADRNGIAEFKVKDAEDPRRRAFFGVMPDGQPVLGATTYVAGSSDLAAALQAMGMQEAVLLDSGFSCSLVFQDKILVTGHTAPGIPSRPVPQALVLYGPPDPGSVLVADAMKTSVATGFASDVVAARRHHRKHTPAPGEPFAPPTALPTTPALAPAAATPPGPTA
jgi:hypothetical protein